MKDAETLRICLSLPCARLSQAQRETAKFLRLTKPAARVRFYVYLLRFWPATARDTRAPICTDRRPFSLRGAAARMRSDTTQQKKLTNMEGLVALASQKFSETYRKTEIEDLFVTAHRHETIKQLCKLLHSATIVRCNAPIDPPAWSMHVVWKSGLRFKQTQPADKCKWPIELASI